MCMQGTWFCLSGMSWACVVLALEDPSVLQCVCCLFLLCPSTSVAVPESAQVECLSAVYSMWLAGSRCKAKASCRGPAGALRPGLVGW